MALMQGSSTLCSKQLGEVGSEAQKVLWWSHKECPKCAEAVVQCYSCCCTGTYTKIQIQTKIKWNTNINTETNTYTNTSTNTNTNTSHKNAPNVLQCTTLLLLHAAAGKWQMCKTQKCKIQQNEKYKKIFEMFAAVQCKCAASVQNTNPQLFDVKNIKSESDLKYVDTSRLSLIFSLLNEYALMEEVDACIISEFMYLYLCICVFVFVFLCMYTTFHAALYSMKSKCQKNFPFSSNWKRICE